jgi:transposase
MLKKGMSTVELSRKQWRRIKRFIAKHPNTYVGNSRDCKRFIEAVLWIMRSGSQWRLLPDKYGNWNSVYKRFERWSERGVWRAMFEHFADNSEMQSLMIDGSVVRAHACAAGAPHKKGGKTSRHSVTAEAALAVKST